MTHVVDVSKLIHVLVVSHSRRIISRALYQECSEMPSSCGPTLPFRSEWTGQCGIASGMHAVSSQVALRSLAEPTVLVDAARLSVAARWHDKDL